MDLTIWEVVDDIVLPSVLLSHNLEKQIRYLEFGLPLYDLGGVEVSIRCTIVIFHPRTLPDIFMSCHRGPAYRKKGVTVADSLPREL
jgi:hypothetical protein